MHDTLVRAIGLTRVFPRRGGGLLDASLEIERGPASWRSSGRGPRQVHPQPQLLIAPIDHKKGGKIE